MERHAALRPLSRRHQGVLLHAREMYWCAKDLEGGKPMRDPDVVGAYLAFHGEHGEPHFRAEEDVLAVALRAALPAGGHPALDRLLRDHAHIRELTHALATTEVPSAEQLHEIAQFLRDHVQFEEHELFPLAESTLGEAGLAEIERRLDAFKV